MKTLLLLRHAKSSWKDDAITDHQRPLNERGKQEAVQAGEWLLQAQLLPDMIVSSDAKRARRTVERVSDAVGYGGQTLLTRELYLASPGTYLQVLARFPEHVGQVLVVGHNPGLEQLLGVLTDRREPMGTASLAHIRLKELDRWADIGSATRGELLTHWRPKDQD